MILGRLLSTGWAFGDSTAGSGRARKQSKHAVNATTVKFNFSWRAADRNLTIEHSLSCQANFVNIVSSLGVQQQLTLTLNASSLTL